MELIEDLERQPLPIKNQPKYRLGRITNKYLIIEIYSLAYLSREEAIYRLFKHERSTRSLLLELYHRLPQLIPHSIECYKIDFEELETSEYRRSYIVNSKNYLNNDIKLELVVSNYKQLKRAYSILKFRH